MLSRPRRDQPLFDSNRFRSRLRRNGMTFIFFSFTICYSPFIFAQSPILTYAHYVIDTLTSSTMNGRGYVDSADFKAATFIQHEFQKLKLQSFTPGYFQEFHFDTNVFPGKMEVSLNGKELIPGKDFLVDPACPAITGKFKMINLQFDSNAVKKLEGNAEINWFKIAATSTKNRVAGIQKESMRKKDYSLFMQENQSKVLVEFTTGKLTWGASTITDSRCRIQVKGNMPVNRKSKIEVGIDSKLKQKYLSRNVLAFIKGTMQPDSFIVFTAHYDHLGQMGDGTYFPGANDNASGVSMVLNLAGYFSVHPPKYSIAFIGFSGEESGLLGSSYFVEHPLFPLEKIKFLVNLDIVGTGEEGIKVVNATEFPKQFDQLVKLNEEQHLLKVVSPRGKAANSDHYPFYMKGVPCFFIYTMGGISAYHDVYDRPETLSLTDYEDLFKLLIDFENSF